MLISTLWLGTLGFLDDYIKVFKKNKAGLKGKFKIIGQVGLGLIVGIMVYTHPDIVIREQVRSCEFYGIVLFVFTESWDRVLFE